MRLILLSLASTLVCGIPALSADTPTQQLRKAQQAKTLHFVDVGPVTYSAPQPASVLCPLDRQAECKIRGNQKNFVPTPVPSRVLSNRAFRVQSFGGTEIILHLKTPNGEKAAPYLFVEGPLKQSGDTTPIGSGTILAHSTHHKDTDKSFTRLKVTLPKPGVYRVLTATQNLLDGKEANGKLRLELNSSCQSHCQRHAISIQDFAKKHDLGKKGFVAEHVKLAVKNQMFPAVGEKNAYELGLITQQFADFLRGDRDRFPVLPPLYKLKHLRTMIGGLQSNTRSVRGRTNRAANKPVPVVTGSLNQLMHSAQPIRDYPAVAYKAFPNITYGHFPKETLSPVQAAQSRVLADVLNYLSQEGKQSLKFYSGKNKERTLHSAWDVFDALIASGHQIELRNERTYANFLSLNEGEISIQWPVWLDSGVKLSSGENMVAPVGHSQQSWYIRGPIVDAQVTFFLGVNGVGFWPNTGERPAWTGYRSAYSVSSEKGAKAKKTILETAKVAATYYRRIRKEAQTIAKGKPADGYGYLGLCNDSNAAIEYLTWKNAENRPSISTYPIARAAELQKQKPLKDGLDDVFKALPTDADTDLSNDDLEGVEALRRDTLRRLWEMSGHTISSKHIPDQKLEDQLKTLKMDVRR